jgi:hypothetical protein
LPFGRECGIVKDVFGRRRRRFHGPTQAPEKCELVERPTVYPYRDYNVNANTQSEELYMIATREDASVKTLEAVVTHPRATNPFCDDRRPEDLFDAAVKPRPEDRILYKVAKHRNADAGVLHSIAAHPKANDYYETLSEVANNPNADQGVRIIQKSYIF